jgi:5'-nucleotidase
MSTDSKVIVGITARALFDLEVEHQIFVDQGLDAFIAHQATNEDVILKPGAAFSLVKALMHLNVLSPHERLCELVLLSRNSAETFPRIRNSLLHHGLDVPRYVLTSGEAISGYARALSIDLFLSATVESVKAAIQEGVAAALVYPFPTGRMASDDNCVRLAFDGDGVLFSSESDVVFKQGGLGAFEQHEIDNVDVPLADGPFANVLRKLATIQRRFDATNNPIRTALVTARCSPADERVFRTLKSWGIRIDELFFLGGAANKHAVLREFAPHIYFDDDDQACQVASASVPAARVP